MIRLKKGTFGAVSLGLAAAVMLTAPMEADARRKGSFGSRGARTYDAPAATNVAPRQTAPVQRSMTEKPPAGAAATQAGAGAAGAAATAKRGGMAKGLLGGLLAGGLIGALLGGGLGALGGAGAVMALLQIVLIGGLLFFLFRMFRRRSAAAPAPAMAGGPHGATGSAFSGFQPQPAAAPAPTPMGGFAAASAPQQLGEDIAINDADRRDFERLLMEVQDAFSSEDFARLRERTTPEVMSYFAEELSQNATAGRRNSVAGTRLLDAEVAEAWNEGPVDYATIAMRYESIDVMLDRSTGDVVEGDPSRPTDVTELWTFKREPQGQWRLSAIQEA
ncbi:TIM44-like domain-containing protein [Sphingomonas sp. IC4-52]|uniref:TIM44-like domain-containing protein n=1 Tax=Sphingomonas sp. IC4-52 TaxID=2887202 RepID=UPI001D1254AA|nr:TIM44-like domain-containing protein [Sphingomonas sp. IC4-52]MCC2981024.1 TIM44-like domain-containing protein [Sphingomonas sp. IC4-52]